MLGNSSQHICRQRLRRGEPLGPNTPLAAQALLSCCMLGSHKLAMLVVLAVACVAQLLRAGGHWGAVRVRGKHKGSCGLNQPLFACPSVAAKSLYKAASMASLGEHAEAREGFGLMAHL